MTNNKKLKLLIGMCILKIYSPISQIDDYYEQPNQSNVISADRVRDTLQNIALLMLNTTIPTASTAIISTSDANALTIIPNTSQSQQDNFFVQRLRETKK